MILLDFMQSLYGVTALCNEDGGERELVGSQSLLCRYLQANEDTYKQEYYTVQLKDICNITEIKKRNRDCGSELSRGK